MVSQSKGGKTDQPARCLRPESFIEVSNTAQHASWYWLDHVLRFGIITWPCPSEPSSGAISVTRYKYMHGRLTREHPISTMFLDPALDGYTVRRPSIDIPPFPVPAHKPNEIQIHFTNATSGASHAAQASTLVQHDFMSAESRVKPVGPTHWASILLCVVSKSWRRLPIQYPSTNHNGRFDGVVNVLPCYLSRPSGSGSSFGSAGSNPAGVDSF